MRKKRGKLQWRKMHLRIDEPLLAKLAEAAQRSVRSTNGEIIARLRKSFEGGAEAQAS
jgi:hypothetical protein